MKKLLPLYILVFTTFKAPAQVVFCPPGSVWKSVHTRSWPDQTLETENVVFTGTQVVNSETVKVLTHDRFFLDINFGSVSPTYIKQNGDTVFFKNSLTQNNWQILYNYAAQVGQSWYNSLKGQGTWAYTITVTSTQTVSILGQTLKQLTVTQHNNAPGFRNNFSYNITERLGSDMFVFTFGGQAASDGDNWVENLCYTDNTLGTYQYSSKTCDYTILLGLNETSFANAELSLYPNPASGSITLKMEKNNSSYHFTIRNSLGQKVKEGEADLNSQETEIEMEDMNAGVYFISLRNADGKKEIVKRFVKTN